MKRSMILATALVLATACGDDNGGVGPGNGGGAAFTADVTGDVETSIQGDARYGEVEDPQAGAIFAVEMSEHDTTGGGLIQIIRIGSGTPKPGTYPLTDAINGTPKDGDWVAAAYDADNGQVTAIFAATSGSVTVTGASNGKLKGTFNFIAVGGLVSDPGTTLSIAVDGKFAAKQMVGAALSTNPVFRSK